MVDSTQLPNVDINAIATDLNGKADRDLINVSSNVSVCIESWHDNNGNYYRVYSDGWCEQGGYISSDGTVNLLKTFNNLNYTITFGSSGASNGVPRETRASRTTSSFVYSSANVASTPANWQACGYIR